MTDNGHETVRWGETPEQARLSRDVWKARARLLSQQYDAAENRVEAGRLDVASLISHTIDGSPLRSLTCSIIS